MMNYFKKQNRSLKQRNTLLLLEHLHEIELRKLYLTKAYSSLFEYIKSLGYSEMQASERLNAMRLMFKIPEVKKSLETGKLTLTTASQLERFFKNKEKLGESLKIEEKKELINSSLNQSKRKIETLLLSHSPSLRLCQERERKITDQHSELKFVVKQETMEVLEEIKNIKGQVSLSEIFEESLKIYLEKLQKNKKFQNPIKKLPFPVKSKNVPVNLKRTIFEKAKHQCEYVDPKTGRRCGSRYLLELDHRKPYSLGGETSLENLRVLCKSHNIHQAVKYFGPEKMGKYLR